MIIFWRITLRKKIDEIYHASAYKHVSFGEENPYSMIKNNILLQIQLLILQ